MLNMTFIHRVPSNKLILNVVFLNPNVQFPSLILVVMRDLYVLAMLLAVVSWPFTSNIWAFFPLLTICGTLLIFIIS